MPAATVTGGNWHTRPRNRLRIGKDSKWTKVHALPRSQKDEYPSSVQHDKIDLIGSAKEIAKQLKDMSVEGGCLFFAAYLAKDVPHEACDVNSYSLFVFIISFFLG
jgi:hypothetical protein